MKLPDGVQVVDLTAHKPPPIDESPIRDAVRSPLDLVDVGLTIAEPGLFHLLFEVTFGVIGSIVHAIFHF